MHNLGRKPVLRGLTLEYLLKANKTACFLATASSVPCMCTTATTEAHAVHCLHYVPAICSLFRCGAHLEVVVEDLEAPSDIWQGHSHMAVKAPWPRERSIQVLLHVGGRHDDDAFIWLESIHLQCKCKLMSQVQVFKSGESHAPLMKLPA